MMEKHLLCVNIVHPALQGILINKLILNNIKFNQKIRKEHLMNHVKRHTGETEFRCEICQKIFTR